MLINKQINVKPWSLELRRSVGRGRERPTGAIIDARVLFTAGRDDVHASGSTLGSRTRVAWRVVHVYG